MYSVLTKSKVILFSVLAFTMKYPTYAIAPKIENKIINTILFILYVTTKELIIIIKINNIFVILLCFLSVINSFSYASLTISFLN